MGKTASAASDDLNGGGSDGRRKKNKNKNQSILMIGGGSGCGGSSGLKSFVKPSVASVASSLNQRDNGLRNRANSLSSTGSGSSSGSSSSSPPESLDSTTSAGAYLQQKQRVAAVTLYKQHDLVIGDRQRCVPDFLL